MKVLTCTRECTRELHTQVSESSPRIIHWNWIHIQHSFEPIHRAGALVDTDVSWSLRPKIWRITGRWRISLSQTFRNMRKMVVGAASSKTVAWWPSQPTVPGYIPRTRLIAGPSWCHTHCHHDDVHIFSCEQVARTWDELEILIDSHGLSWMFLQELGRCMEGKELLTAQTFPTTRLQSETCRAPQLSLEKIKSSCMPKMAGNSMSIPCLGCVLLAAVVCIEPIPKWSFFFSKLARCVQAWMYMSQFNCRAQMFSPRIQILCVSFSCFIKLIAQFKAETVTTLRV